MFMGQFDHSIDAKGRAIIPAKFRNELGVEFVVTIGPENCLYLYPEADWEEFMEKFETLASNHNTRKVQRLFMKNSSSVSLDKQGRILIPTALRTYAGLEKDLAFIGMKNHVEIWDKNRLDAMDAEDDSVSFEDALDSLGISM